MSIEHSLKNPLTRNAKLSEQFELSRKRPFVLANKISWGTVLSRICEAHDLFRLITRCGSAT